MVPELIPPILVVGEVFPIDGVVPVVVFGVVPEVVLGVVPDVVFGVVPVVVLVAPVVVGEALGTVAGAVDGEQMPEVLDAAAPVGEAEPVPMVLPVGFVEVVGVVDVIGQVVDVCGATCGLGDAVGLIVLDGAIPPVPVVRGPALPVIEGVLLPPVVAGADVCPIIIVAAKHTTVIRISADLLIIFSPGLLSLLGWLPPCPWMLTFASCRFSSYPRSSPFLRSRI